MPDAYTRLVAAGAPALPQRLTYRIKRDPLGTDDRPATVELRERRRYFGTDRVGVVHLDPHLTADEIPAAVIAACVEVVAQYGRKVAALVQLDAHLVETAG